MSEVNPGAECGVRCDSPYEAESRRKADFPGANVEEPDSLTGRASAGSSCSRQPSHSWSGTMKTSPITCRPSTDSQHPDGCHPAVAASMQEQAQSPWQASGSVEDVEHATNTLSRCSVCCAWMHLVTQSEDTASSSAGSTA
ncbi:unnamed protein product [Lampetra fluviatilis]